MKFAFIASKEVAFPVLAMCRALGVTRSGFYAWSKRPKSPRAQADAQLAVEIAAAHEKSGKRYGSPRVHRALRKRGVRVGAKRIARLMRERGIVARQKRRFRRTTDSNHANPIAPNVLARDFAPAAPNQAWAGDVTYIATSEGWMYLAVLLDLFSRRVVGWAMSSSNDTALALAALRRAVSARHAVPVGLVHHTDRGSPYASENYRDALAEYGMIQSMSRTGDCWDNAVAESFFATLRAELVDGETYATARSAERSVGEYIESFYNIERLHSHLDYVSPIEFELKNHIAAIAA
jgi:transposase InsO family protein